MNIFLLPILITLK